MPAASRLPAPGPNDRRLPGRSTSAISARRLATQRLIESHLSVDVDARLEWDSEGDMLWVCGAEADIRAVADAMQSLRQP